jgi:hypothetical protein
LEREGETSFSPLLTFSPKIFYLIFFFLLILRFYFTMVLDRPFLPFLWPINYNHISWCNKSSTHSLPIWFWLKKISFLWIHGVTYDHVLWAFSCTSEWRSTLKVIPKFDVDATSLWWRSQIARCASSFWKLNPLELGMIIVLQTFAP